MNPFFVYFQKGSRVKGNGMLWKYFDLHLFQNMLFFPRFVTGEVEVGVSTQGRMSIWLAA